MGGLGVEKGVFKDAWVWVDDPHGGKWMEVLFSFIPRLSARDKFWISILSKTESLGTRLTFYWQKIYLKNHAPTLLYFQVYQPDVPRLFEHTSAVYAIDSVVWLLVIYGGRPPPPEDPCLLHIGKEPAFLLRVIG